VSGRRDEDETYEEICIGPILEFLELLGDAEGSLGGHPRWGAGGCRGEERMGGGR